MHVLVGWRQKREGKEAAVDTAIRPGSSARAVVCVVVVDGVSLRLVTTPTPIPNTVVIAGSIQFSKALFQQCRTLDSGMRFERYLQ